MNHSYIYGTMSIDAPGRRRYWRNNVTGRGAAGMLFSVFLYLFSRFSFISYVQFSSSRTGHQLLSIKVKKIVRRAYVRAG